MSGTAGSQASPYTNGTKTGASAISPNSSGNSTAACTRMMRARIRRTSSRSRLRESTGNATRRRIPLIFDW